MRVCLSLALVALGMGLGVLLTAAVWSCSLGR
jgi:hypothetical protein